MAAMKTKRLTRNLVCVLAAGALLVACGQSDNLGSESDGVEATATPTEDVPDAQDPTPTDGGDGTPDGLCDPYADYAGNDGTVVTIVGPIVPVEQQLFEDSWAEFEECTGIDIAYEGGDQRAAELEAEIQSGGAPDIAWLSRPAALARLVASGEPIPAPAATESLVAEYWNPVWKSYGTVNDTFYAAPVGSTMKSIVWYSPRIFVEKGYAIPTTWNEMWALSDQMVADGVTPWCGGLESGSETGWPASDWLAQVMLRLFGSDVYDQWVEGDLPFSSPEVGAAMDIVAGWMKNPRYVNGGHGDVGTIPVTPVGEAGVGIPTGECGMLQQGSSAEDLWGTVGEGVDGDTEVGPAGDVYAFYLPEVTPDFPQPVISDGLFAVAFADRPEVQAVQTYLASPEFHTSRVARGGWVSANTGVPLDAYPVDSIEQMTAGYLTDPKSTVRLDASDLMPAVVGAGALPGQMTAWFADEKSTSDTLAAIDAAWPPR